ncbi:MAG: hypothetical protein R3229_05750 [Alphaproteobacteria bacterium]|nr:hypothetical protein [Alphaproteobacteria bacterium]
MQKGSNFRRSTLAFLVLAALAVQGCAATAHLKTKTLPADPEKRRIVVLTPDVELSILHAGGLQEPNVEWTELAKKHIAAHLTKKFKAGNIRMVKLEQKETEIGQDRRESQLRKLHQAVGHAVLFHQWEGHPLALPTKAGTFEWTMGPEIRYLKQKYGADFALFIFIRDSYASSGRAALIFFGALLGIGIPGGAQVGFASLVDLETGDVVWFNRLLRPEGDLRTTSGADETMKLLLADMPK